MLALEVQVEFAEILVKLRGKQATVSDLSQLLYLVRLYKKEIPDDIKLIMLSIPNIVLRDNCELKSDAGKWASKYDFMKYVLEDQERLNSDFYLRNPEVTLRDDVCIKSGRKFQNEQIIYAMVLEKALMM